MGAMQLGSNIQRSAAIQFKDCINIIPFLAIYGFVAIGHLQ